eukprot:TRINITY_DN12965_c0_g1_i1.p2 TRINITY_DN12965_c0_g1~~TRINITY_DN12965_c0_g1_i1.p2  ORF type:complete len:159 (-),score=28.92 TRINITY_DN12965_c0_g1_i1:44-520(-)
MLMMQCDLALAAEAVGVGAMERATCDIALPATDVAGVGATSTATKGKGELAGDDCLGLSRKDEGAAGASGPPGLVAISPLPAACVGSTKVTALLRTGNVRLLGFARSEAGVPPAAAAATASSCLLKPGMLASGITTALRKGSHTLGAITLCCALSGDP